jgi:DNA-binding CsgD family transcriptional regulator
VYGLTVVALLRLSEMRSCEALELSEEAVRLLGQQPIEPDLPMAPHFISGLALMDLGRCDEAENAFAQGLADCEDGAGTFLEAFHVGRSWLLFNAGRWDDALAEVTTGLETSRHLQANTALRCQSALIALHRGEAEGHALPDSRGEGASCGYAHPYVECSARALSQEAEGDREGALQTLFDSWETSLADFGPRALLQLGPDAARLAAESGDTQRLDKMCRALEGLAAASRTVHVRALESLCWGLLESDCALLRKSAQLFHSLGCALYEAYAFERMAVLFARSDRQDEARNAFHSALALYDRLDATWDAARAEKQLTAVGLRARRRSRGRPRTGWEALTETEHAVIEHVAVGCSNPDIAARLFLSPRTVQFHLTSIFSKLGITSRVELAVIASRRAIPAQDSRSGVAAAVG